MIDSSGSVQSVYEQQKVYLNDLLDAIQISERDHRIALIQFAGSHLQKTEWTFDKYGDKENIKKAFQEVRHFTGKRSNHVH